MSIILGKVGTAASTAIKSLVGLLFAVIAVWIFTNWLNRDETPYEKAENAQATVFAQRAITAAMQPTWERVVIEKASGEKYDFIIRYRGAPDSLQTVANDERLLIHAVLSQLANAGIDPTKAVTNGIEVFGEQVVPGETGTPLYRSFGYSFYNPIRDQVEFKRP